MRRVFAIAKSVLFFCLCTSAIAANYPPNIDYGDEGDFIAKRAVEQGRMAMLSTAGPILIANPILPGSSRTGVDEEFTDTSWDLSDLTNPTLIQKQNCHQDGCFLGGGIHFHAHVTSYVEDKAYLASGRYWKYGTGGWLTYDASGETSIEQMVYHRDPRPGIFKGEKINTPWRYSHLTSPYDTIDYWEYNFSPSGLFQIRNTDRSHGVVFAEWDHSGLTGVRGFLFSLVT